MLDRQQTQGIVDLDDLYNQVLQALRAWHNKSFDDALADLLIVRRMQQRSTETLRKAIDSLLVDALEQLEASQPDLAKLLYLRFEKGETSNTVANRFSLSISAFSRRQERAVRELAAILAADEEHCRKKQQRAFELRLEPSSYGRLFGLDESLHDLLEIVADPASAWIITLEGMGGIGKTSFADALLRNVIRQHRFDGIGWVSARQQRYELIGAIRALDRPAMSAADLIEQLVQQLLGESAKSSSFSPEKRRDLLRNHLKEVRHLIVLDNLETVSDVEALLPTLHDLANPTKFILTSRQHIHSDAVTYSYTVPELPESHALELIRYEAAARNQQGLAEASDAELRAIVQMAGGNPLALRLIVGQTRIHGLSSVLTDLQAARGQTIENFYTFIYRYAWDRLDETAQQAFIAMPLVPPQGGTLEKLASISKLEAATLRDALTRLVNLNLIHNHGGYAEGRYTIHNLTRTFLLNQVAKWMA